MVLDLVPFYLIINILEGHKFEDILVNTYKKNKEEMADSSSSSLIGIS